MKLITRQMPYDFNLFHFGDRHKGATLSSDKGWEQLKAMMLSPYEGCKNNYGIEGGDDLEAIMVDDPRFGPDKLTEARPIEQRKAAIKERRDIAHLLIAKLEGNHDRKLWRFGNIIQDICDELNEKLPDDKKIEFGTYTAKISFVDKRGDLMFKVYETHGSKAINSTADDPIRKKANELLMLKRKLRFKAGDCALMVKHYAHKLLVVPPIQELYLIDDGKKIKQRYTEFAQNAEYIHPDARWYGCAGAFLRLFGMGVSGYGEIAEYDPTELGWLVTRVRNRRIVSVDPIYMKL
jgi:hypothetical protein